MRSEKISRGLCDCKLFHSGKRLVYVHVHACVISALFFLAPYLLYSALCGYHSLLQIRPRSGGGTKCHICQAVLIDPLAVSTHYRIAHAHPPPLPPPWRPKTSTPATFECARCDHKYTSKHGMQYHMAKWHGIGELPTFQCDVCGRIFHQKCDLKRHTKQVHKL